MHAPGLARRRRDVDTRLPVYRSRFGSVGGFFTDESQVVWDFLLSTQTRMGVRGGFMEIGVLEGKSALLAALHMRDDEPIVLVDISSSGEAADAIRSFHPDHVAEVTARSSLFRESPLYGQHRGRVRFLHVDGDHSGYAVFGDLLLASEMVGDRALVALDDFGNMRYPQLHAAVYKFLFARPDFRMVLCGANKAYLCRTEDFALYDALIRDYLVGHAAALECPMSLARTSYAHDHGCFSVQPPSAGGPLVGRDEDPGTIPF